MTHTFSVYMAEFFMTLIHGKDQAQTIFVYELYTASLKSKSFA